MFQPPAEASPSRPVPGPDVNRPKAERDLEHNSNKSSCFYRTEPKETQAEAPRPEPVVEAKPLT